MLVCKSSVVCVRCNGLLRRCKCVKSKSHLNLMKLWSSKLFARSLTQVNKRANQRTTHENGKAVSDSLRIDRIDSLGQRVSLRDGLSCLLA